jgi:hypothetical protein
LNPEEHVANRTRVAPIAKALLTKRGRKAMLKNESNAENQGYYAKQQNEADYRYEPVASEMAPSYQSNVPAYFSHSDASPYSQYPEEHHHEAQY